MLSGDIFEFNADKFVARAKTADGWLCSRMVMSKFGDERPTVGKPRLFKHDVIDKATVISKYNLVKPAPRSAPEVPEEKIAADMPILIEHEEKTPEQLAQETEERRAAVERLIHKTGNGESLDW